MTKTDAVAPIFCLVGLLYVVSGFVSPARSQVVWPVPLAQVRPAEPVLSGSGFARDAVPDVEQPKFVQGPLTYYGSFLDRGDSRGSVKSAEFRAIPDFYMFVSGFPNRRICNYALASRAADILLMMVLPAIRTQHSIVRPPFVLSDICALCMMTGATVLLCVWMFRVGTDLRWESNHKMREILTPTTTARTVRLFLTSFPK
jgi:hypothetical protein